MNDDKKYQVMPDLTDEEYAELKADIAERGVQVPIEFDTDGNIIDGYHRFKICQELGWVSKDGKILDENKVPRMVRVYNSEEAKFTQARKLNLARRHLSQEQKGKLIDEDIISNPEKSVGQVAEDLDISKSTAWEHKKKLVDSGQVFDPNTSMGADGKKYPSHHSPTVSVFNPSARDAEALKDPDIQRRLAEDDKMNVAGAIREQTRDNLIEHLESVETKEAKAVQGVYDVIVIDPPWPMQKIERDVTPEQVAFDYPTMSIEEIKQLKIPAADDCHVFLWTTQKFLPYAFNIFETWGVKYVCEFVWHKNSGYKPFKLPTYNHEQCLYGHIGSPEFVDEKQFWTCFDANTTGHSKKPDEFYDTIRRVTAGRRLDMFNRRRIEGFDAWGKEAAE